MSGLSHILEGDGLSTVTIGLIPQHVRRMRPPRALLVPFDLGRPLGAPGRPDLQREVLHAALQLLDQASSAPYVTELDTSIPLDEAEQADGWSCPVTFPTPPADNDPHTQVQEEVRLLRPWYDRGHHDRGHTAVGASGLDVPQIITWLFELADGDGAIDGPGEPLREGELGLRLKLAVEDLKAFYLEAATSQPGSTSAGDAFDWYWNETAAANLLRRLRSALADHEDPFVQLYAAGTLIPSLRPS